jgi:hypothetical protein
MTGFYSIAEVVDDSNKRPEKTVLVIVENDTGSGFSKHQFKSLGSVGKMVENNGGKVFYVEYIADLRDVTDYLNNR